MRQFVLASLVLLTACGEKSDAPAPANSPPTPATSAPATHALPPRPDEIPAPADVAAPPADAEKHASGLASKVLQKGNGTAHPNASDVITFHYTCWTTDGRMCDSSILNRTPVTIKLDGVPPGLGEGIPLMVPGEKRRLWIPQSLAFQGRKGAPPGTLVFDVELISFKEAPKPIPAPSDVEQAPADATKTATGLAYKVLAKGAGTVHPTAANTVEVHYTGWTTDGKMFDSSVVRGETISFPLTGVIPGWTEGVQLMVEGEKTRFWIPVGLAYQGQPGMPAGMLVFDVELIKIR